ncbi:hypothetical protein GCM10010231_62710 [Streptomyces sindenensis]|nr:hypothetical protein GCM10010231_62710 [Streptomyces sindenensis]
MDGTGRPVPRFDARHLVLAVDVSPGLRTDALCSAERLFCYVYGRAKTASQVIPGRPRSFVAALEPGATFWTAIPDAVRLGPADDAVEVWMLWSFESGRIRGMRAGTPLSVTSVGMTLARLKTFCTEPSPKGLSLRTWQRIGTSYVRRARRSGRPGK